MRADEGKIIIGLKDLDRKVVVIRNAKTALELQQAQFAAMKAVHGCFAIKEESFAKYNQFRYDNKRKRIPIEEVLVIDLLAFEKQDSMDKFKETKYEDTL